jgi:phosphonate transport system substrate-binding protein
MKSPRSESDARFSRREIFALTAAFAPWMSRARAAEAVAPVRLAISETLVSDVNLNDARVAMAMWLKQMMVDLNVSIEIVPKVFEPTAEIVRRVRSAQVDAAAMNIIEYRQLADVLDPRTFIGQAGPSGAETYVVLVKRSSGMQHLGDLRARRLARLTGPHMCLGPAWLATVLDEAHLPPAEQFFGSITQDGKAARVVLPVFFGQADACLTTKHSFETLCELNPQVGRDLAVIACSPEMVLLFYAFRKNYSGPARERFARVYTDMRASAASQQVGMLFQFEHLETKDIVALRPGLAVLEKAERLRGKTPAAGGSL